VVTLQLISTPKFSIHIVLTHLACVYHKKIPCSRVEGDLAWSGLKISRCDAQVYWRVTKIGKYCGSSELRGKKKDFFFCQRSLITVRGVSMLCLVVDEHQRYNYVSRHHIFCGCPNSNPPTQALFSKRQETFDETAKRS
jgi:hypothetical protein